VRILSVVGARPQFVKLAPIVRAAAARGVSHEIVHTGQHYDTRLSAALFSELRLPDPDVNLGVGSGSHAEQTARTLLGLEAVLLERKPDWVLVYGDTNSSLAAALAAAKLGLPNAHVEAGVRCYRRDVPEEINRVLTDHASDLLLAPTTTAMRNLRREGLRHRCVLVGDVMVDTSFLAREELLSRGGPASADRRSPGSYVVATLHRPENTDDPQRLRRIVDALTRIPAPVLLMAHPRLVTRCEKHAVPLNGGLLELMQPATYLEMVGALMGARCVVTDSGGLQREAFLLGTPCITLRGETEWAETLADGWNVLDPDLATVAEAAARRPPARRDTTSLGDGQAAERIMEALLATDPSGARSPGS
jgi:UDP-N-acetylglucosamine 2-epimerase (non-hydrolysing)